MPQPDPESFFCVDPPTCPQSLERGRRFFAQEARFLGSVASTAQLPSTEHREVCFAGRSNVGKSSLLNALTSRNNLARTSNTPGRTQHLNYFALEMGGVGRVNCVDLPGYGYAKAPMEIVRKWQTLLRAYLSGRPNLHRAFVLIDSRHGIKAVDHEMMSLLDRAAVPFQILLTKSDKPSKQECDAILSETKKALLKHTAAYPVILTTSSSTGSGICRTRAQIVDACFDLHREDVLPETPEYPEHSGHDESAESPWRAGA